MLLEEAGAASKDPHRGGNDGPKQDQPIRDQSARPKDDPKPGAEQDDPPKQGAKPPAPEAKAPT